MGLKRLQDMALFALVAESGSFTAAARRAGLPKSSVSQRISQLEQAIGLRLLNRTTRQLNLTFAGERYLIHCQEMIQASERADLAIERLRDNPSGRLRITSPAGIGATNRKASRIKSLCIDIIPLDGRLLAPPRPLHYSPSL